MIGEEPISEDDNEQSSKNPKIPCRSALFQRLQSQPNLLSPVSEIALSFGEASIATPTTSKIKSTRTGE